MLNSMGCGECGTSRGNYNAICSTCQRRKRRSQQQRNRRKGSPEKMILIPQSSISGLILMEKQLSDLHGYFIRFPDDSTSPPNPKSLKAIRESLKSNMDALEGFLSEAVPQFDEQPATPIRRYRRRRSTT
jgi:hypothetical protein